MRLSKKYIFNILLVISLTAIAMYFSLRGNFAQVADAIRRMNPFMLILVLCWGLLFTAVWGVSYQVLGALYKKKYSLWEGICVSFVGTFFAGITPSSTGGQFGQIYVLKKQGINYSDGASLLWADFIIYQTTMMIYVTILFALRFSHYANLSGWFWIVFAGYIVNLIVIIGLYTMALFPKVYIRLSGWAARLLGKMHLIKDPKKQELSWTEQVENFTVQIKKLSSNWPAIIKCMIVNFLRLSLYFSLPFIIARGLSIELPFSSLIDVLALASFVTMANSFIPLPGASGGTEVVFTLLFRGMMGALTGAVMLLWRFSSYYIPVITGAIVFIVFKNHQDHLKEMAAAAPGVPDRVPAPSSAASAGVPSASAGQKTDALRRPDDSADGRKDEVNKS